MSYSKITGPFIGIENALTEVLGPQYDDEVCAYMLNSGVGVAMEDGSDAWVSCFTEVVENDRVVILTAVIALVDNQVIARQNGTAIARAFSGSFDAVTVAATGIDNLRRSQMLMALGEDDGVDDGTPLDAKAARTLERSIRTAVAVNSMASSRGSDVL